MKKLRLVIILVIIIVVSCDKKYELIGHPDAENEDKRCILERIYPSEYFDNSVAICDFEFDKNGVLWVATSEGLLTVEDTFYEIYDTSNTLLKDNYILSVTVDKNNNVWLTSAHGLYRYIRLSGIWQHYGIGNPFTSNYNSKVFVDSENIIYTTDYFSLYQFTNESWEIIFSLSEISDEKLYFNDWFHPCIKKQDSIFWLTTTDGLLKYVEPDEWIFFNTSNSEISTDNVYNINIDNEGRKWFETSNGIEMFDDFNWYFFDLFNLNIIDSLIICNDGYSISFYKNNYWHSFLMEYNDRLNYYLHVTMDNEGFMWFSSSGGIYKLIKNL